MSVLKNYVKNYSNRLREHRDHKQKRTTGWIYSMDQGMWFYLRDGTIEAQVFKVCHADTMQQRWAGKIYGAPKGSVGQTFEDDYSARSVVEVLVNLMVTPRE